jgi:hypothetical protein
MLTGRLLGNIRTALVWLPGGPKSFCGRKPTGFLALPLCNVPAVAIGAHLCERNKAQRQQLGLPSQSRDS